MRSARLLSGREPSLWLSLEEELRRAETSYRALKSQYEKRRDRAAARKDLIKLAAAAEKFARRIHRIDEYETAEQFDLLNYTHRRMYSESWHEDVEAAIRACETLVVAAAQQPRPSGPERNVPARWLVRRLRQIYKRCGLPCPRGWEDWVYSRAIEIEPETERASGIEIEIQHLKRAR